MIWQFIDGYVVTSTVDKMGLAQPTTKTVTTVAGAWLNNFRTNPSLWLIPIAAIVLSLLIAGLMRIKQKTTLTKVASFVARSVVSACVILTAGVAMFPFVMPSSSVPNHSLLMWDTVASETTLGLMFVVVAIFIPLILSYTIWCYAKMWRTVTIAEIEQNSHSAY